MKPLTTQLVEVAEHAGPHAIKALSVAGLETCIHVPKYDLLFDIGRCPEWAVPVQNVFVSHGHTDHAGGLHFHSSHRALQGMLPPRYFVPERVKTQVDRALMEQVLLDGDRGPRAEVVDLSPGKGSFQFSKRLYVDPFPTNHRVPSQGYLVLGLKKKVKREYQNYTWTDYAKMRKDGVEFEEDVVTTDMAFSGDTRIEGLKGDPRVGSARVLISECSFVDGPVEQAREKGHIHIDEIVMCLREGTLRNEHIVLTHFSNRYTRDDVLFALHDRVPAEFRDRITAVVNNS